MIRNTTNKTQAMLVAVPATPVKPTTPAMRAMTRNVMAQLNIRNSPLFPYEKGGMGCLSGMTRLPSVDGLNIPRLELQIHNCEFNASLLLWEAVDNLPPCFGR
jgi:hypothetical protein